VIACQTITVTNPGQCHASPAGSPFQRDLHADRRRRVRPRHECEHVAHGSDVVHRRFACPARPIRAERSPITVLVTDSNGWHRHERDLHPWVVTCPTITVTNPAQRQRYRVEPLQRERSRRLGGSWRSHVHSGYRHFAHRSDAGHQRRAFGYTDADPAASDHGSGDRWQRLHGDERHVQPDHRLPDHQRHQSGQCQRHGQYRVQRDVLADRRDWLGRPSRSTAARCRQASRWRPTAVSVRLADADG